MHTTRPTSTARRLLAGLAAPALALALAACGDDESAGSESFCDAAREIEDRFSDFEFTSDEEFEELMAAIDELEPPAEIADDWETVMGSFERFAEFDPSDPESFDESAFEEMEAAGERVDEYMREECGIGG